MRRLINVLCLIAGLLSGTTFAPLAEAAARGPAPASAQAWVANAPRADASAARMAAGRPSTIGPSQATVAEEAPTIIRMPDLAKEAWRLRPGMVAHDVDGWFQLASTPAYRQVTLAARPAQGGYLAENYPATVAMAHPVAWSGDSVIKGIGTVAPFEWTTQFQALTTGGTFINPATSGTGYVATSISPTVTNQIITQLSGQLSTYDQYTEGLINDIDPSTNTNQINVVAAVKAAFSGSILPALTGLPGQWWQHYVGPMTDGGGPGNVRWSSSQQYQEEMTASYGAHIVDMRRWLQWKGLKTDPTDLDYILFNEFWSVPLSLRGLSSTTVANTVETTIKIVSIPTNSVAGIQAAEPASGYAEGDFIVNTVTPALVISDPSSIVGVFNSPALARKDAAGNWVGVDTKHCNRWCYGYMADLTLRLTLARNGTLSAPVPGKLFLKQDAASTTAAGTIYYVGPAPTSAALFDVTTHALITTLTLADNGSSNNAGSISVTRSATGTLSEGRAQYEVQLVNGSYVLRGPVDLYVGEPSTQTVPRLWLIPNSAATDSSSDFTCGGPEKSGLADGSVYNVTGYVRPTTLTSTSGLMLLDFEGPGSNPKFYVMLLSDGRVNVTLNNAAGTFIGGGNGVGTVFAVGQTTWFSIDIDTSGTTTVLKGVFNKNGTATNTAVTWSGQPSAGPYTAPTGTMAPRFFSLKDTQPASRWHTAADSARRQFKGSFGEIMISPGLFGLTGTPATDNTITDTIWNHNGGAPAARAAFAAVNGVTPVYDLRGGKGDILNGGPNRGVQVYCTEHGVQGLSWLTGFDAIRELLRVPANDNRAPSPILLADARPASELLPA